MLVLIPSLFNEKHNLKEGFIEFAYSLAFCSLTCSLAYISLLLEAIPITTESFPWSWISFIQKFFIVSNVSLLVIAYTKIPILIFIIYFLYINYLKINEFNTIYKP